MSEPEFRPGELIDWGLAAFAVAAGAVLMGIAGHQGPSEPGAISVLDVRRIEQELKVLDAVAMVPPEMQETLGVTPENEEDNRARAVRRLREGVERAGNEHQGELILIATLAVCHDEDRLALEALDAAARREGLGTWSSFGVCLAELANQRACANSTVLTEGLKRLRASPWLESRLLARQQQNRTQNQEALATRDEARRHAGMYIQRFTFIGGVGFTLFLIGTLLLIAWPLVRRALSSSGFVGLGDHPSPFVSTSTTRVMALWFFGFVCIGTLVGELSAAMGSGSPGAWAVGVSSLLQGVLSIYLIRRFGRPPGDRIPLAIPLRLGLQPSMRSLTAVFSWSVGGLAISAVVVVAATIIAEVLFGGSLNDQPAMELFAHLDGDADKLLVGLCVVVIAPIFEEILFRGFLMRNLRDALGSTGAIAASGLLFGVIHLQPDMFVPLMSFGFVLGALFEISGTLIVPIAVHALWNLGQLVNVTVLVAG